MKLLKVILISWKSRIQEPIINYFNSQMSFVNCIIKYDEENYGYKEETFWILPQI